MRFLPQHANSTPSTSVPAGYTLVEMLVAICIVVICSMLIFTGVHSIQDGVAKGKTIANLKAIVTAWNTYASDHDDFYPLGLTWTPNPSTIINPPDLKTLNYRYWWRWYGGVAGYLPTLTRLDTEAALLYNGPNAPGWENIWHGYYPANRFQEVKNLNQAAHVGYHFNTYMGYNRRIKRAAMNGYSKIPLLFPYWDENSPATPLGRYFSSPLETDNTEIFMRGATHPMGDGNEFAFADGHVEWVPKLDTAEEYAKSFQWRP